MSEVRSNCETATGTLEKDLDGRRVRSLLDVLPGKKRQDSRAEGLQCVCGFVCRRPEHRPCR